MYCTCRWNASQHVVKRDIGSEMQFLPIPPAFDPPLGGFPSEYYHAVWYGKTRMVWLPDGEKILKICLFVLTECTNVTDTHTHRQTHTAWRHKPHLHSIAQQLETLLTYEHKNGHSPIIITRQKYCHERAPVAVNPIQQNDWRLNISQDIANNLQAAALKVYAYT